MLAYRRNILPEIETVVPLVRSVADRDSEILRLWDAKWSARKIAEHLAIETWTVGNVVHKHGCARNPRGPRYVGIQDAPVEAWQQAIVPELEKSADAVGAVDAMKRAFVFACLLRLKRYDDLTWFKGWCHQVTGYEVDEIRAFAERGINGHLIVDGQPDDAAFRGAECLEGGGDVALVLFAGVFLGTFERTVDDRYTLATMPTHVESARWDDDGGYWMEAT